jgi:hypothetical protein
MANKIQIRRGLKANLPSLDVGEPALCTDTKEVFVGNSGGNVALVNKEVLDGHLKDYTLQIPYAATTGSANTYKVSLDPAPTAYVEGMAVAIKINVQNTGASTININGLGAKSIKKANGNNVSAGNLKAGSIYSMRYNGTNFILQGSDSAGDATPADVLSGKTFSNDEDTELTGIMPNRSGHVTAQSIFRSGTTLRFRPQPGYYNGAAGNSVQKNDTNFVASNIRKGVTLFGIAGTLIPACDYKSAPGPQELSRGDMGAGYFGRYTGIFTAVQLSSAVGVSRGSILFYSDSNIEWLKFVYEGKIIYLAQKPIRYDLSWNDLNNAGCVYGEKQVTKDETTYKCRLLRIRNSDPSSTSDGAGRERNLLAAVHINYGLPWDNLDDDDMYFPGNMTDNAYFNYAQETLDSMATACFTFHNAGTAHGTTSKSDRYNMYGWRPVLEVV